MPKPVDAIHFSLDHEGADMAYRAGIDDQCVICYHCLHYPGGWPDPMSPAVLRALGRISRMEGVALNDTSAPMDALDILDGEFIKFTARRPVWQWFTIAAANLYVEDLRANA